MLEIRPPVLHDAEGARHTSLEVIDRVIRRPELRQELVENQWKQASFVCPDSSALLRFNPRHVILTLPHISADRD